jgi:uncharacterized membrane protein (Fun14 family)
MTIDPSFTNHSSLGPTAPLDGDHGDPVLEMQASAALARWLRDHPEIEGEFKEAVRASVHLMELDGRARQAERGQRHAEQSYAALLTRHDPAGQRILGFTAGAAFVITLLVLDAIPLNWAAQAFDLNSAGTWLVTLILLAASIGAMLGFELTRGHSRRRRLLIVAVGVAYLALLGLRAEYLITVASETHAVALLQSAMLTAISAGLVLFGSVAMARTRSLVLSRSRAAARHARQAADAASATRTLAAEALQRQLGALRTMLLPWALGSTAPDGVDRTAWAAALERAIHLLFPAS